KRVSTTYEATHLNQAGLIGLIQRSGNRPQLFHSFQIDDAQGKALAKDEFNAADGTIPAGWKYVSGGPNPVREGIAGRIDAIGWHPTDEPNAAYFKSVRKFQETCRRMG